MATVKGVWVFNEDIIPPSSLFKIGDGNYDSIPIASWNGHTDIVRLQVYSIYIMAIWPDSSAGSTTSQNLWNNSLGWNNKYEEFKTITFYESADSYVTQEFYDWLTANATQQATEPETTAITFDLSTLGLSAGTYSITVKARADGYADSAESSAVSYTVESALISFTVNGTSYQVVDGTTWYDWIDGNEFNSELNSTPPSELTCSAPDEYVEYNGLYIYMDDATQPPILGDTAIISGDYVVGSHAGSEAL